MRKKWIRREIPAAPQSIIPGAPLRVVLTMTSLNEVHTFLIKPGITQEVRLHALQLNENGRLVQTIVPVQVSASVA